MMWRLYLIIFILFLSVIKAEAMFVVQKPKWKTVEVMKLVDNERFMLKSQKVIRIIGVDSPSIFLPDKFDKCYTRSIYRTLDDLIVGKKVKIFEDYTITENQEFNRHVKLKDGTVLTTYMLERGMAKFDASYKDQKYLKQYKEAVDVAKADRLGIWRGCNPWNNLRNSKRMSGRSPFFWSKYHTYLSNSASGRVAEVISGNSFRLENGLVIKIIGVEVPNATNESDIAFCFSESSKLYLESLILDKKVRLVRDRSQLDEDGNLLRYVYLDQTKYRNKVLLNKKIVQNGYGKSFWSGVDNRFEDEFETIQSQVYKNPNGAWKSCVVTRLNTKDAEEEVLEEVLEYDESCRIKGNIAGSKKNPRKTFHTPKSGWYKRIEAEECFETEEEAVGNGFRKIK